MSHAQSGPDGLLRNRRSLNGAWQARFDAEDHGFSKAFPAGGGDTGWVELSIPSALEAHPSFAGRDGVFWLRQKFTFSAAVDPAKRYRLYFDRVIESVQVWLNGSEVGVRNCGDTPFYLDISNALNPGDNMLVVRLQDAAPGFRAPGPRLGGICGSVWIDTLDKVNIDYLNVKCSAPAAGGGAATARIDVACENGFATAVPVEIRFEITKRGEPRVVASGVVPHTATGSTISRTSITLQIPDARQWNMDDPQLYHFSARLLRDGVPADVWTVTGGMRTVAIEGPRFVINGNPTRIRAVTDHGFEPGTLLTPSGFLEPARKVKLVKEAGFNAMILPWRVPPAGLVEAADAAGMLLILQPEVSFAAGGWRRALSMPLPIFHHPAGMRLEPGAGPLQQIEEQVRSMAGHPSVVMWMIPDAPAPVLNACRKAGPDAIVARAARLSGKNYYFNPGSDRKEYYLFPRVQLSAPFSEAQRNRLLNLGDRNEFTFATVDAGFGFSDGMRTFNGLGGEVWREESLFNIPRMNAMHDAFGPSGLNRFFGQLENFLDQAQGIHAESLRRAVEIARANPRIGAVAIPNLVDSPGMPDSGLFDGLGRQKREYTACKQANVLRRAVTMPSRHAGQVALPGTQAIPVEVLTAPVPDHKDPVLIKVIEVGRPDKINGFSLPGPHPKFSGVLRTEMGCAGGEGSYVVNPFWDGLTDPFLEEARVEGILISGPVLTGDTKVAKANDRTLIVVHSASSWAAEDFTNTLDALEFANDGGVSIFLSALQPGCPLLEAGLVPGLHVTDAGESLFAVDGGELFAGIAPKGIMRDPMNELVPAFVMSPVPEGSTSFAVAIGSDGIVKGSTLVKIPYGRGFLVVTTHPLAEMYGTDVVPRRMTANAAAAAVNWKSAASHAAYPGRSTAMERYQSAGARKGAKK